MWTRFQAMLRCPMCESELDLRAIEQPSPDAVESGLFLCSACRLWYPIFHGLPVLLPYETALHHEFRAAHGRSLPNGYQPPRERPAAGEEFVLRSFSKEWLEYDYDGVLWSWKYEDREGMFLGEIGRESTPNPTRFLEVGCGLGLVTSFAAKHFPGDAVGVDLSLAAMRAAQHFRDNPRLHFVQASLWRLPFADRSFDLVYSHGVLHHTYSTEQAFRAIGRKCRPGGRAYVWVYGEGSKSETLSRRIAYGIEQMVRPLLARLPGWLTTAILAPIGALYMVLNRTQRLVGRDVQPYTFQRAMHAARDRLTPLFAFRQSAEDVAQWFRDCGFDSPHHVAPAEVPPAARVSMRRNVGMRAVRADDISADATPRPLAPQQD